MSRITTYTVLLFATAGGVWAQTPGEISPAPSPTPAAASEQSGFSDSLPSRDRAPRPAASSPNKRSSSKGGSTSSIESAIEGEVIKVGTNLVTVPVSVYDRNGLYVPGLQRSDFKVYEDGAEQEIAYFGSADKPFTVILLLDTSYSTNYKIEEIRQAANEFVDQLRSEDSVMVIEFDRDVHVLTKATRIRPQIFKAISKADFGYGTSLYDAVDSSLRKRLGKIEGRKAIVLFTDGVDTTSTNAGFDTTLSLAEESDALIFPIYYNTFDWNSSAANPANLAALPNQVGTSAEEYARGRRYLSELAEYTGGRVFRPEAVPGGLTSAFKGIAEELRRQYNLGYVPKTEGSRGQRKNIKVRVNRPNLIVRARSSYIVGSAQPEPAN